MKSVVVTCQMCGQPVLLSGEVVHTRGGIEYAHASGCPIAKSPVTMAEFPICDICGAPATRIASKGSYASRRFKCEVHRYNPLPPLGRPENASYRTNALAYEDLYRILSEREEKEARRMKANKKKKAKAK